MNRELKLSGFAKLSREERLAKLVQLNLLSYEEAEFLKQSRSINPDLAENFIENAIGYFQIPLDSSIFGCSMVNEYSFSEMNGHSPCQRLIQFRLS